MSNASLPSSIYAPAAFLDSLPAGFDGVFDWAWVTMAIQAATRPSIRPMDIDCHVEVNGHHLIFETKDAGKEVPSGQRRALLAYWAKGYTTVVFLWGKSQPLTAEIYYPSSRRQKIAPGARDLPEGNRAEWMQSQLMQFVYNWGKFAMRDPCPFAFDGRED